MRDVSPVPNLGSDTVLKIKLRGGQAGIEDLPGLDHPVDQMRQLAHHRTDHRLRGQPCGPQAIAEHAQSRIAVKSQDLTPSVFTYWKRNQDTRGVAQIVEKRLTAVSTREMFW